MFDIDKYLGDMEIKEMDITEDILTRTKKRCEDEQRRAHEEREAMKKVKKAALIAVPVTAVLLIGVFLGAWLFSAQTNLDAVAYYTVDVNPSLCVHVNGDGSVKSVVGQNEDAKAIVDKLDCSGKNVADAIGDILSAVKDAGYFDAGQRYVLIGCFAADGTQVQGTLGDLQARLEADFGDMINLLIVSGNLDDLQEAYQLNVSPGLLKLAKLAEGVEVTGGEKVEDVYKNVQCAAEENYCAPELSAGVTDKINLSWDEIDFDAMGYAGKVRYSIAAGDTKQEAQSGNAPVIETFSFYTYADQPRSYSVNLEPGTTKYFVLYAQYGDTVKYSNVVKATMPGEATVSPTPSSSASPTDDPGPDPTETPLPAHTVSGYISGDKVVLKWSKETAIDFQYYKIVASRTNPNPSYPDDGYLTYFTDAKTTSVKMYEGYEGLKADTYYYFSVTYVFENGTTIAANAVRLKVPPKSAEPTDKPTNEPTDSYPSSSISGGISDSGKISLSWSKVTNDEFEYYKLVYSFSNNRPVYQGSGCELLFYSSDPDDRSYSCDAKDLCGYEPGKTCYFSVTVLYDDGTKVKGNVKTITMPDAPPEETDKPYESTNIRASLVDGGKKVKLTWDAINDERFKFYKILMASDSNPTYPGDMVAYFDKSSETVYYIDVCDLCGDPGDTVWFRITVIYEYDVKKPGATDSIKIPVDEPDPTETPADPPSDPPSDPPCDPSEPPCEE